MSFLSECPACYERRGGGGGQALTNLMSEIRDICRRHHSNLDFCDQADDMKEHNSSYTSTDHVIIVYIVLGIFLSS